MRKVILLFSAVFFALSAVAEDTTEVFMDIYIRGDGGSITKVNRSLVQVPSMEIVYDAEAKTIRITSSEPAKADVYIYNANGAVVGHADTLNTIEEIWTGERALELANWQQKRIQESSPCSSCELFEKCLNFPNKCLANTIKAYGDENWDYPDPRCSRALPFIYEL